MQNNQSYWEVIRKRRSIRKFTNKAVPDQILEKAIEAAILAPNSSNIQAFDFYIIDDPEKKQKAIQICLNQSAARTASRLVVLVADPGLWKRSNPELINYAEKVNAPESVKMYYKKLIPVTYSWGFLNSLYPLKFIIFNLVGLFKPFMRRPAGLRDLQEVAIKSAALAAENFVLAVTAQGFSTCMMEGFDEYRLKKLLNLSRSARVVMVIAIGEEAENGTWGPQFRLPVNQFIKKI